MAWFYYILFFLFFRSFSLLDMIIAMEMLNKDDIEKENFFRGLEEPFRYFESSSMEYFKEKFDVVMRAETEQVWKDNFCDDTTHSDLWETIQKTMSEIMDPEDPQVETFMYNPDEVADPLKQHHNAL
ncbi:hypothetical protein Hdeb2414_s0005g00172261 [Helianthus debilis subsp. tardiflorus]